MALICAVLPQNSLTFVSLFFYLSPLGYRGQKGERGEPGIGLPGSPGLPGTSGNSDIYLHNTNKLLKSETMPFPLWPLCVATGEVE